MFCCRDGGLGPRAMGDGADAELTAPIGEPTALCSAMYKAELIQRYNIFIVNQFITPALAYRNNASSFLPLASDASYHLLSTCH